MRRLISSPVRMRAAKSTSVQHSLPTGTLNDSSVPIRLLNMTEYRLKQLCVRLSQQRTPHTPPHTALRRCALSAPALVLVLVQTAYAQGDPWTASANNLQTAFTGPIATALIAVAVVVTGMVFAFSEGQGK